MDADGENATKQETYDAYKPWASAKGFQPWNFQTFCSELKSHGIVEGRRFNKRRFWRDVLITSQESWGERWK